MSSYWVNFAAAGDPNGKGCRRGRHAIRRPTILDLGDAVRVGTIC
jgi:hypothetical protein